MFNDRRDLLDVLFLGAVGSSACLGSSVAGLDLDFDLSFDDDAVPGLSAIPGLELGPKPVEWLVLGEGGTILTLGFADDAESDRYPRSPGVPSLPSAVKEPNSPTLPTILPDPDDSTALTVLLRALPPPWLVVDSDEFDKEAPGDSNDVSREW